MADPTTRWAWLYYLLVVPLAFLVVQSTLLRAEQHRQLSAQLSPSEMADTRSKQLLEILSFGLYRGAAQKLHSRQSLERALAGTERRMHLAAYSLVACSTGFLGGLAWTAYRGRVRSRRPPDGREDEREKPPARARDRVRLSRHLLATAAIYLVVGAVAPILTVVAYQELAVVGRVVFSHESKSLVGTMASLSHAGNWLVAGLLGLFSLVVPVIKLTVSAIALSLTLRGHAPQLAHAAQTLLHHLGKWSMTDVFVVAILVAFLSAEQAEATEAFIGLGLYFFAGHTVLAVLASVVAPAALPSSEDSG